ncbi:MAG: efflux RND transporter periplasmic adaptor subunit [Bacteroidales bacterium]|nr:efflux RND transporter periplasmic adaptor subunit [Bacteroidales bacterium]
MKKALKITLFVLLGLAVVWTFVYLWKKSRPEIEVFELEKVDTLTITRKTVATGKVNPRDEISIVPQLSGIVSELLKDAGDKVQKNEVIARIKVIPDVSSLNSAESQVENATLTLELATKDFERVKKLHDEGVVTLEEYQRSENSYLNAQKNLNSAKNNLDIVKNGVTEKYASYSNTNIKSTVTGTILSVPIKVGNSVIQANTFNAGTTIATIADMSDMLFVGNIDETEVGSLNAGMELNVTIGAIKDRVFNARLEYISPQSKEENGAILFEIKAAVEIPNDVFVRAGYSANAEIILEKAENVMTIPESAVVFDNGEPYVQVYEGMTGKHQKFTKKNVTLGLSDGINVQVISGLDGSEQLKGAQIKKEANIEDKQ